MDARRETKSAKIDRIWGVERIRASAGFLGWRLNAMMSAVASSWGPLAREREKRKQRRREGRRGGDGLVLGWSRRAGSGWSSSPFLFFFKQSFFLFISLVLELTIEP